jgi:hypothetical protein
VLAVLAGAGAPASLLSWRAALGAGLSPAGVLGGALTVVGLALLAAGLINLVQTTHTAEKTSLLGRPAGFLSVLGVAVLLCAAIAVA